MKSRRMDDEPTAKRFKQNDGEPDKKFLRMLQKHGYEEGKGLGSKQQGIVQPIAVDGSTTTHGLGHDARKLAVHDPNAQWDDSVEDKSVEEFPEFIESTDHIRDQIGSKLVPNWIVLGEPLTTLRDSVDYCDADLVNDVIEAKAVFDNLSSWVLNEARRRANPYETVMGGIFQNRAAMKTANLDRVFDWRLSREFDEQKRLAKNPVDLEAAPINVNRDEKLFYFADVCAGPGGFSEYMIWRKAFYNVKGFGFTLRGNDDFKLQNFKAGSSAFFETFYGAHKDGDVTNPENLETLEQYVKHRTNERGCDLVMCDGGFSVAGKEEIQEVLSKRLYLCQFIVGLLLARVESDSEPGGNYLCKLFDVFTSFSAGLIYLMYSAFRKVSLHKPNTSRPANSERYIFCEGLTEFGATIIKNYLIHVNEKFDKIPKDSTILEIVPYDIIADDEVFFDYYKKHNEEFARKQIIYLNKYREFSKNKGAFDQHQADLREQCLTYWEIPDKPRPKDFNEQPAQMALKSMLRKNDFMHGRFSSFSLRGDEWAQAEKQVRIRELVATLMPEFTAPMFLVSNERGDAFIFREENNSERLEDLRLPPKTLLLVQEMTVYKSVSNKLEPYSGRSKMLFVVDGGRINNDDIAALNYESRLTAIRKFCQAINRGVKSIETDKAQVPMKKRKIDQQPEFQASNRKLMSYYLHCAETVELFDLEGEFSKLQVAFYKPKCLQLALRGFEFPEELKNDEENNLLIPCQAVRFVQRYKAESMLCWSNSNSAFFVANKLTKTSNFSITEEMFASFFDHLPSSCYNNKLSRRDISWMWSWKIDSKSGYGPDAILNQNECEGKLTTTSLCAEILKRQSEYPEGVMTEPL